MAKISQIFYNQPHSQTLLEVNMRVNSNFMSTSAPATSAADKPADKAVVTTTTTSTISSANDPKLGAYTKSYWESCGFSFNGRTVADAHGRFSFNKETRVVGDSRGSMSPNYWVWGFGQPQVQNMYTAYLADVDAAEKAAKPATPAETTESKESTWLECLCCPVTTLWSGIKSLASLLGWILTCGYCCGDKSSEASKAEASKEASKAEAPKEASKTA